jgi:hypothetical protein
MTEKPKNPVGMAIPEDFLNQLRETPEKLWPTCKNCMKLQLYASLPWANN